MKYKSIKVKEKTWVKLVRMKATYASKYKERITLDELIRMLMETKKKK